MFRDIWKRFGAKIGIVLCSVLLLGGVAIAAPRLRAADGYDSKSVDLADITNLQATNGIYEIDPDKLKQLQDGVEMPNGIGKDQLPSTITGTTSKGAITLKRGVDYEIVNTGAGISEVEDSPVNIRIEPSTDPKGALIQNGKSATVEFSLQKNSTYISGQSDIICILDIADYNKATGKNEVNTGETNRWVSKNFPVDFEPNKWEIYYEHDTFGKVPLVANVDYVVPDAATDKGNYSKKLVLKNYTTVKNVSATVYKDINSSDIKITADDKGVITVIDGTEKLDKDTHYEETNRTATSCNVVGIPGNNYVGTKRITFSTSTADFNPYFEDYTLYYDVVGKIDNPPPTQVYHRPEGGGPDVPLSTPKDYIIQNYRIVDSDDNEIDGATAGKVRMDFVGQGDYAGAVASKTYTLKRKLVSDDGTKNPKLEVQLKPEEDFEYTGEWKEKKAEVSFSDTTGLLTQDTDYELEYTLERDVDGTTIGPTTDITQIKDAGWVSVSIKGTGYYEGTLAGGMDNSYLRYQIKPKPITEATEKLVFRNDNNVFELTEDVQEKIFDRLWLQTVPPSGTNVKVKGMNGCRTTYTFSYDKEGKQPIADDDWNKLSPDKTYFIQVKFEGNYSGTLPAEFKIQDYDPADITVTFDTCEECGAQNGEDHIYTGGKHEPPILSIYNKSTQIYVDQRDVQYSSNIDVGTMVVSIPVTSTVVKEEKLKIVARDLATGTIKLSDSDKGKFTESASGVKQHEYTGYTNLPTATKLTLEGSTRKPTLELKDSDYTVGSLYEYDESTKKGTGSAVSAAQIQMDKKYCYRVIPAGKNLTVTGATYAYTEPFEFTKRSLKAEGEQGIVFKVKPITDYTGDDKGEYLKHLQGSGNLIITDKKFGEDLRSQDYKIEESDIDLTELHKRSVVKVTIHGDGGYKESKTVELYVGINITLSVLKEKGLGELTIRRDPAAEDEIESTSGTVILNGDYGDVTNLPFLAVGEDEDDSKISLRYYRSSSRFNVLYKGDASTSDGGQYSVVPKNTTPQPDSEDDASGKQYCTVLITGKSGYYGTITVKVPIAKVSLDNYEIRFRNKDEISDETDNNVYTGEGVEPKFDVVLKTADPDRNNWSATDVLKLGRDYEVPTDPKEGGWKNNIKANEGTSGNANKASLTIRGIYGYEGTLTSYFTVYKRSIGKLSNVTNPDGSSAGEKWVLNDGFTVDGWKDGHSYDYTPSTKTDKGEANGVLPQLKLSYKGELLKEGSDYTIAYDNQYNARCYNDNDTTYDNLPKVKFSTLNGNGNSNFKGNFEDTYEIQPIVLLQQKEDEEKDGAKCKISLQYETTLFTGEVKEPQVRVTLYRDGDKKNPWVINAGSDFDVTYTENTFVTIGGSAGSSMNNPFLTCATITGKGNLQGTVYRQFIIQGELEPTEGKGVINSKTEVTPRKISYNPNASAEDMKEGCIVTYYEKIDNPNITFEDSSSDNARKHVLTDVEYTVTVANKIGTNLQARLDSAVPYFKGGRDFEMTIVGDLEQSYIKYTVDPISYAGSDSVELDKFLTVTYDTANGSRALSYGTDYTFDRVPTANLGKNVVNIIPTDKSKDYLINQREIEYYVTANMDGVTLEGVDPTYQYAHGRPVIKPEDIIVKLNNKVLSYGTDYDIEIVGDAINVGTHTIRVIGKGTNFSGTKEQSFEITKYNLSNAVSEKIITVNFEDGPVYTGSTVLPKVTSVTIKTPNGSLYTLSDGSETNAEYAVVAGSNGDHVNWTYDEGNKPNFVISGRGNYEGEVSYDYSIKRKNIADKDEVVIAEIEDIYYNNGKDITPVPSIKYKDRDLEGILHSGNAGDYANWLDFTKHFTYQYSTDMDLKNVGNGKSILIQGIGNFTGSTTVTYNVIPLPIKEAELVFVGDTPVYNGLDQKPAFNLVYGGEVILQWTGTRVVSDYISNANVVFENNKNATQEGKLATVTVSIPTEVADNYQGTKEATFTIQPAPLAGHTRFLYHPGGENAVQDLSSYRLNLPFEGVGTSVIPQHPKTEEELLERTVGVYYQFPENRNVFLVAGTEFEEGNDYVINYQYVEPDTDDVEIRDGFGDAPTCSYAGKVKVTITGVGNYTDSASYWYFIGKDIASEATIRINPTTTVYNAQQQAPAITITGVDKEICTIGKYRGEVAVENLIEDKDFVNAGDYFIRVEGNPKKGTYSTQPQTLKYTITPRPISSSVVIDNYKKEYAYTGFEICPVGLSVTDYIEKIKYRLTEELDYTLSYANNVNAGTATITVNGQNNFSGTATAKFLITSSTITSGGSDTNSPFNPGTGEISGATAIKPDDVKLSMDTTTAMYYTGSQVYPKVSIAGMTENVDYTVTYSNNVEVGMATIYISGIGNNNGMITKNFDIIAQLSKCTVAPIPAQRYTGSAITPSITVTCGSNILVDGVDYVVSYANNVNIGTATVTIRSANNSNYVGSTKATFSISNDVGGFIISGYAPSYVYTGKAITPAIVVETGSATLTQGTDYTVTYADNVNAGMATITVTGIGKYSGTQSVNFIIEPKSLQSLSASGIEDKTYTGDAYTPSITISDGDKVLTNGVDYTVTYTNNTAPGLATAVITGTSSNYTGTKIVSFKIAGVAVKGLQASSVKDSSLKLSWVKQDYADGYQICDSKSKGIKSTTKNSISLTGLKGGTTYKYKVRSFIRNEDGTRSYGAFSSLVSATTKLKTPTVKIVSQKKGQAKLSWSKVSGATGYEIYYKKSSKAKYRKLKTINKANTRICTVKGMKSGDRAYFRVRAFKKSGSKKIYSALNPLKVITIK